MIIIFDDVGESVKIYGVSLWIMYSYIFNDFTYESASTYRFGKHYKCNYTYGTSQNKVPVPYS